MKKIIIRLNHTFSAETDWAEIDAAGNIHTARSSLPEIRSLINNQRIIALLPASEVLITRVVLPAGRRKRQIQAVPFILEESLAADVEELHFVLGSPTEDHSCPVAVIARKRLDIWLNLLAEADIEPAYMTPDVLAVPFHESPSILIDGQMVLCRTGVQDGFAFELANLEGLRPEATGDDAGFVLYGQGDKKDLPATIGNHIKAEHAGNTGVVELLASGFSEENSINLLQGDYSPHAQWKRLWINWRLPAGLALTALILALGVHLERYYTLKQKDSLLTKRIEHLYSEVFPEAQRIVNPQAQMEHNLRQLREKTGTTGGFLPLLNRAAPLMKAADGFSLEGLHYHEGRLDMEIRLTNLYALDDLKNKLTNQGLAVTIRTASSLDGGVQARLQVKENSP